jgi:hypothetical protein
MAKIGDGMRRRIIVVDLDPGWRFAALVRTLALDLLGRARDEGIAFRTLYGNVTPGTAPDGRDAVWGAFWPRLYLDDRTSLIAELEEALDSVDPNAGRMLDICVVLPAPTRTAAGAPGGAFDAAVSIWAEFVAILAQRELVANVGRFALVRPGDNTPDGPEVTASMAGLLRPSERGGGDAPFDRVVMLGQRRGQSVPSRQFLLLRAFLDLLDAARDRQTPPAAANRAEDFIAARSSVDILDFESATPPASLSERLASLITRKNGIANETRGMPTAKSDTDNFTQQIDALLQKLSLWTGHRTHAEAGAKRHDNGPGELDSMKVTYWSTTAERTVQERIEALQEQLTQWWKDQMAGLYGVDENGVHDLKQRRLEFIQGINDAQFNELRKDLDHLNLSPAGLSGVTQAKINQELQKIEQARAELLASISANRAVFAYSGADASYEGNVDGLHILNSFSAYVAFASAATKTIASLRELTQRRYVVVGASIYIAFALLTVVMYSLGDAQAHALPLWDWWIDRERPAVPALWAVSILVMILGIGRVVLVRRQRFEAARADLGTRATELTRNIHRWTDSVRQYTSDVLHVRFYDEFIDAIKFQRDWNARERFSAEITHLSLGPQRERTARLGDEQATQIFTDAKEIAKRVPLAGWFQRVVPTLYEKIDPRPGAPIVVHSKRSARAVSEATYKANGTAFIQEVRLISIDLAHPPGPDSIEAPPT